VSEATAAAVAADPPEVPSGRSRRRILLVLAALSAFGPLTTDVYLPGLPGLAHDLGAGTAAAQLTLTACVIGLALGQLFIGPLSDMTGRRLPLLASLGVFIVASLGCAAAPSLPLLIAARFVQGAAGAGGIVVARAMVRDIFVGDAAARAYSNLSAIVTSGPIFAPLLGALILLFADWRGVFVTLAVIGVLLIFLVLRLTTETLPAEMRKAHAVGDTLGNIGVLLRHRNYLAYVLAGAFGFGTMFAYIAASSFVYQDVFGTSAQLYSVLFAVNGLALMGANVVNGRLVGRVGPEAQLRRGLTGLVSGSVAVALAAIVGLGAAVILPLLLVTVGSVGFVVANAMSLAMSGERARAGAASALFGLFQFGIGAIIAPLVGVAGNSAVPMGIAMAISASLAALSYSLIPRRSA
jgi:DHA1 family bicyclomycin/chloramphenicol resistance-like MFS transporter